MNDHVYDLLPGSSRQLFRQLAALPGLAPNQRAGGTRPALDAQGVLGQNNTTEEGAGHSQENLEGYNFGAIVACLFIGWGFVGNILVCLSIITDKRLQNVTNYFLFSLACADLMVCTLLMPFTMIVELHNGVWPYNDNLCVFYVSCDVFLCSVSIVHMSTISLDRYWGIRWPLKTRNKSTTVLGLKIAGVWIATILIACPITVLAVIDLGNILQDSYCQIFNRYFQIYGSVVTFFIPFVIMAFTYAATVRLLQKQATLCSGVDPTAKKRGSVMLLRRSVTMRKSSAMTTLRTSTDRSNSASPRTQVRLLKRTHSFTPGQKKCTHQFARLNALMEMHVRNLSDCPNMPPPEEDKFADLGSAISNLRSNIVKAKDFLQGKKAETTVANEQKATKVLGVVFFSFFVCWAPFFTLNITLAICGDQCAEQVPSIVGSIVLWLGYFSSTVNPIIYTTFNRTFRQSFRALLCCRFCHPTSRRRNTRINLPKSSLTSVGGVNSTFWHVSPRLKKSSTYDSPPSAGLVRENSSFLGLLDRFKKRSIRSEVSPKLSFRRPSQLIDEPQDIYQNNHHQGARERTPSMGEMPSAMPPMIDLDLFYKAKQTDV